MRHICAARRRAYGCAPRRSSVRAPARRATRAGPTLSGGRAGGRKLGFRAPGAPPDTAALLAASGARLAARHEMRGPFAAWLARRAAMLTGADAAALDALRRYEVDGPADARAAHTRRGTGCAAVSATAVDGMPCRRRGVSSCAGGRARQVGWVWRRGVGRAPPRAYLQADLDLVMPPGLEPAEALLGDAEAIRAVVEARPVAAGSAAGLGQGVRVHVAHPAAARPCAQGAPDGAGGASGRARRGGRCCRRCRRCPASGRCGWAMRPSSRPRSATLGCPGCARGRRGAGQASMRVGVHAAGPAGNPPLAAERAGRRAARHLARA